MPRFVIRLILALVLLLSFAVAIVALRSAGPTNKEAWATVAAALAVITSVISSWSAQRVLEQQEDQQQPYAHPTIDIQSRVGLVLLRIVNYGGSPAYDIRLDWSKPLHSSKGELVRFNRSDDGGPEVHVLMPKESIALCVDGHVGFYQSHKDDDMRYEGVIKFKDASGKQMQHPFTLSVGQYSNTLAHDTEGPKAFRDIQDIPDELRKLTSELGNLRRLVEYKLTNEDEEES